MPGSSWEDSLHISPLFQTFIGLLERVIRRKGKMTAYTSEDNKERSHNSPNSSSTATTFTTTRSQHDVEAEIDAIKA